MLKIKEDFKALEKFGFIKENEITYNLGENNELLIPTNNLLDINERKVIKIRYLFKDKFFVDFYKFNSKDLIFKNDFDKSSFSHYDWFYNNRSLYKIFGTRKEEYEEFLYDLIQAGLVEKVGER